MLLDVTTRIILFGVLKRKRLLTVVVFLLKRSGRTREPGGVAAVDGTRGAPSRMSIPGRYDCGRHLRRGLAMRAAGRRFLYPRRLALAYILRTSTHPIEYPAPNEQITPFAPLGRSSWYLWKAMIEPADEVFA